MVYANIIVDISQEKLDKTFQYIVPEQLKGELSEGMRVVVPFGSRRITGYVVALTDTPEYDVAKLKPVLSIEKEAVCIESELIALAAWMHKNCGGTMNQALKTVLPVKQKTKQGKKAGQPAGDARGSTQHVCTMRTQALFRAGKAAG